MSLSASVCLLLCGATPPDQAPFPATAPPMAWAGVGAAASPLAAAEAPQAADPPPTPAMPVAHEAVLDEDSTAPPPAALPPPSESEAAVAPDGGAQEITVTASEPDTPGDPAEKLNAQAFAAVQAADDAIVAPAAKAYQSVLPKPVRSGLRNFLRNLEAPVVAVNFLLQGKPVSALETVGRFAVNTTVGVGGLFDVAKDDPFNLPYRRNGFANTLGYYGVGPGPYLYLPLIGPTTARDLVGLGVDRAFLPAVAGPPFNDPAYSVGTSVVRSLDYRIELDEELMARRASDDPYAATRDAYLTMRQAEIDALKMRGRPGAAAAPDDERAEPLATPAVP